MVTIITEKLRNQSLDDVKVETVPVLQTAGGNTWAFTTSPSSPFQLTGNLSGGKGWTMFVDPKDRWPGQPTPGTTPKTTTLAAGPPLTGGAASRGQVSGHAPHPQTPIQLPSCPSDAKFAESCAEFEAFPSTPPAPPLKRHCRSLSIPSDRHHSNNSTKDGGTSKTTKSATSATTKWQPHAGQIWRPVASRPHSNKLGKSRGSPLSSSLHRPLAASRSSPHSHTPVATPAAGIGGAYATKGIWPLSKSEDFSTPPDSPVPRPASASSGFCDSLVNSSWLEKTVAAPTSTLTSNFPLLGNNNNNNYLDSDLKLEAFRLRSLSMEEPISRLAATAAGGVGRGGTCSMPAIPGSNKTNHSTPSSPRRHRVQRCRSQPCVLHDRKCLKRRRDEERPALDFLKMTETAYDYGGWKNSGRCPQNIRWTRSLASLFTDGPHCVHGLNTIASSPLDGSAVPAGLNHPATGSTDSQSPSEEVVARRHTDGCRGQHQQRRPTSDSARRATGKGHDIATFIDSEDGCDCHDANDCKQADGEMFEMEMNNDIDIDQIEKD